MSKLFKLCKKRPVPCSLDEWSERLGRNDHRLALDYIGRAKISTVFLAIDHNFSDEGPPLLFETLVFGGDRDGEMYRYATWEEAETGHKQLVDSIQQEMLDKDIKAY